MTPVEGTAREKFFRRDWGGVAPARRASARWQVAHPAAGRRVASRQPPGRSARHRVPAPERLLWHKRSASTKRLLDPAKADKDLVQAATLTAALVETDTADLVQSALEAPAPLCAGARQRLPRLRALLAAHPEAAAALETALAPAS